MLVLNNYLQLLQVRHTEEIYDAESQPCSWDRCFKQTANVLCPLPFSSVVLCYLLPLCEFAE